MQIPESWLREFCNPAISTEELVRTLTMGGFEVEGIQAAAPPFTGVIVGEITEAVQHPNADRLRVCQVDIGEAQMLTIVCGAPNARVGIRVPCARVGAMLPPPTPKDGAATSSLPFEIKLGKIRDVESQGMLCSATELGISQDHSGLLELQPDAPLGQSIRDHLNLDAMVLTIKLTPNLGHALSVYGVARELSALTGAPLAATAFPKCTVSTAAHLPVCIEASDLCGRFSGRVIQNVNTQAKTPQWMVDKLARCGQRSITALVDISNYVMFEFGRPTHIFDLDKINGNLNVRWGRGGESLKLLNGTTVVLDETVGVIADAQAVESLAGIMGGDRTSVTDDTQNVYVEAAFWWPEAVAGRSRRFNIATDAGHRFERGVDATTTTEHLEHVTALILSICGRAHTQVGPIDDQQPSMPKRPPVQLRASRASRIIGIPLTPDVCAHILRRCGFELTVLGDAITVTPPAHRFDLNIEEDLIEEVARVSGFDQLPDTAPVAPVRAATRSEAKRDGHSLRMAVAQLGYSETINFSFVEEQWERDLAGNSDPIRLLNPIASQMSVMRSSLLGSLIHVLKFNLDRQARAVRVFELGRVFKRAPDVEDSNTTVKGVYQPMMLAGLSSGAASGEQWALASDPVDFYDAKADVECILRGLSPTFEKATHPAMHPGRSARVLIGDALVGHVGELHPKWQQSFGLSNAPMVWELDAKFAMQLHMPVATPISKFQPVERDIALVVAESVPHDSLLQAVRQSGPAGLLLSAAVFDVYRAKHEQPGLLTTEKSCAVRLVLHRQDATLTEPEIEAAVAQVLQSAGAAVGARLRS